MRVRYLQHVPFEGPGCITAWARDRGHELTGSHLYRGDPLPKADSADALIVMGGPMGVDDEAEYPWLRDEKRMLKAWLSSGKPILGICLGAQLLASVLGAKVVRNRISEIGWFPIKRLPQISSTYMDGLLPKTLMVLHWHHDTFDIPAGAIPIATSGACTNQGFVYHDRVVGLQFHMEMDLATAHALVDHCADAEATGDWVQSRAEILGATAYFAAANDKMFGLLDTWIGD
jgi:GMP synthase-like glutamine amidotransferase